MLTVMVLGGTFNKESGQEIGRISVEAFGARGDDRKDDSSAIQAAINSSYESEKLPVQLLGKTYILKQGLRLKEGVALEMGMGTKLLVEGDFNVLELERKTSISNGTIEITTPQFQGVVLHVSGKERIWTTERIHIENVTLYNSSGTNRGKGISFTAGTSGEFISFVNVSGVNVSGFNTALHLQTAPPQKEEEHNFVNGNRFVNMTLDDCVVCIHLDSEVTIPNEVSGNMFDNLQIQLTERTDKAVILSGTNNTIEGMIWDASIIEGPLIVVNEQSYGNFIRVNLPKGRLIDKGQGNNFSTLEE
ncbi:glycosyl hydrolase family 28-related protein [Thalassobacillus sp. CUG 92003]|uniref:glycosyl hydrolase family 28-related protein n=1 Tax=Thalassobacillus sp. CUG 92003 TaxID=2736641 RepID=UPI0015E6E068|nr:glycosyl hydrolase family 28-related protein [Thalassobacillus sp. CUG 92003]